MKNLFAILLCICHSLLFAAEADTLKVVRNGNTIEVVQQRADTIVVINPQTYKQEQRTIIHPPTPISLNGTALYFDKEAKNFIIKAAQTQLQDCIRTMFKNIKDELPAGTYTCEIPDLVIDADGKAVYFSNNVFYASKEVLLSDKLFQSINKQFAKAINEIEFIPLTIDGEKVPFRIDMSADMRLAQ